MMMGENSQGRVGDICDDSSWLQAMGFWNDAGVSSHTLRSVHAHERDKLKATHVSHGTKRNTGAFFPTTLRRGTQRNTLQFERCKRTTSLFSAREKKVEMVSLEASGAAFIPRRERRCLSPRFGKGPEVDFPYRGDNTG
jgi:hypothetical protein